MATIVLLDEWASVAPIDRILGRVRFECARDVLGEQPDAADYDDWKEARDGNNEEGADPLAAAR